MDVDKEKKTSVGDATQSKKEFIIIQEVLWKNLRKRRGTTRLHFIMRFSTVTSSAILSSKLSDMYRNLSCNIQSTLDGYMLSQGTRLQKQNMNQTSPKSCDRSSFERVEKVENIVDVFCLYKLVKHLVPSKLQEICSLTCCPLWRTLPKSGMLEVSLNEPSPDFPAPPYGHLCLNESPKQI